MSTRIRYERTEIPEVLASVRIFRVANLSYRVKLNTNALSYSVEDIANCITVAQGSASTLNQLKIKAKNELLKLGVQFGEESRNRNSNAAA